MKTKELLLALAIAIMAALFVGLLVDAIYEEPQYDDYCTERIAPKPLTPPAEDCSDIDEAAVETCQQQKGVPEYAMENGCRVFDTCNTCYNEYHDVQEVYNRNLFFIITPLAVASILFGLFYAMEVIGSGFMFGGILLLIYSTGRYFGDMSKVLRVIVIGIELALLLWITKKKMSKK